MDITVVRNGYGRQVVSEVRHGTCRLSDAPLEMVFIRAPVIERTGPGVDVLAEEGGHPVLVRQGRLLAATFHPELTSDSTVHRYFLDLAGKKARAA
jgi:5'-phosphate synthase pdxT subunit